MKRKYKLIVSLIVTASLVALALYLFPILSTDSYVCQRTCSYKYATSVFGYNLSSRKWTSPFEKWQTTNNKFIGNKWSLFQAIDIPFNRKCFDRGFPPIVRHFKNINILVESGDIKRLKNASDIFNNDDDLIRQINYND